MGENLRRIAVFWLATVLLASAAEEPDSKPVLRRGIPGSAERQETQSAVPRVESVWSEVVVSADGKVIETPIAPPGLDPLLEEAKITAEQFAGTLPDFTCEQLTTRYTSFSGGRQWELLDRITADVLYLDGREQYSNIRRDGRPAMRAPAETGTWSSGEFGTMLRHLFAPTTHTAFEDLGEEVIFGVSSRRFGYRVQAPYSRWKVVYGGRTLSPAYDGRIWVDPATGRVLRIEMIASEIPADYPLDTIEMVVDFGPVLIGAQEYLLPARSKNLSCVRGTRTCDRNEIEFRGYRRFIAESTFTAAEPAVPVQE